MTKMPTIALERNIHANNDSDSSIKGHYVSLQWLRRAFHNEKKAISGMYQTRAKTTGSKQSSYCLTPCYEYIIPMWYGLCVQCE